VTPRRALPGRVQTVCPRYRPASNQPSCARAGHYCSPTVGGLCDWPLKAGWFCIYGRCFFVNGEGRCNNGGSTNSKPLGYPIDCNLGLRFEEVEKRMIAILVPGRRHPIGHSGLPQTYERVIDVGQTGTMLARDRELYAVWSRLRRFSWHDAESTVFQSEITGL